MYGVYTAYDIENVMWSRSQYASMLETALTNPGNLRIATQSFLRPWFSRVWIIQEVCMARDAVVCVGNRTTSWSVVGNAARWLLIIRSAHWSSTGMTLEERRNLCQACGLHLNIFSNEESTITLLLQTAKLKATDPRDKIYALLSFEAVQRFVPLAPNYRESKQQVHRDTAISLVRRSGALEVLSYCEDFDGASAYKDSWVPNWSYLPPSRFWPLFEHYDTDSRPKLNFSNRDWAKASMRVAGLVISSVAETATESDLDDKALDGIAKIWLSVSQLNSSLVADIHENELLLRSQAAAIAWTLTAGFVSHSRICILPEDGTPRSTEALQHLANFGALLMHWTDPEESFGISLSPKVQRSLHQHVQVLEPHSEQGDSDDYDDIIGEVCAHRKPFRTESGAIGLGHLNLERGDVVVALVGTNNPFVLGPVDNQYVVICDCYLHGYMHNDSLTARLRDSANLSQFQLY